MSNGVGIYKYNLAVLKLISFIEKVKKSPRQNLTPEENSITQIDKGLISDLLQEMKKKLQFSKLQKNLMII